jgi:hypothetical protein
VRQRAARFQHAASIRSSTGRRQRCTSALPGPDAAGRVRCQRSVRLAAMIGRYAEGSRSGGGTEAASTPPV